MEIRRSMSGIRKCVIVALVCVLVVMSKDVQAHVMPTLDFISGSDERISSVTGVEVLGVTYEALFHHSTFYLEFEAAVPSPLTSPYWTLATTASTGLVDVILTANKSLGPGITNSTAGFYISYNDVPSVNMIQSWLDTYYPYSYYVGWF